MWSHLFYSTTPYLIYIQTNVTGMRVSALICCRNVVAVFKVVHFLIMMVHHCAKHIITNDAAVYVLHAKNQSVDDVFRLCLLNFIQAIIIYFLFKHTNPYSEHFCCAFCHRQLNKGTFKEYENKSYCHKCYEKLINP